MRYRHALMSALVLAATAFIGAQAMPPDSPAAPTFQELMRPDMFPDPQFGMKVEANHEADGVHHVRTTGARIALDAAKGEIRSTQRIGHERLLATARLGAPLKGLRAVQSGPGFTLVKADSPAVTIRINGDSLCMVHVHGPLTVSVDRAILPGWHASYQTNHLLADEYGAFGLYCSERELDDGFEPYAETVATYDLPADAVLWVAVCPPKPYDWGKSFKDNVVWHWSRETGYPPDEDLNEWNDHGNIVLLQSEVMLWKDWNLDFVPRLGVEEFERVRKTIHDAGMRFIVYTSPYYFTLGTPQESQVMNSFENFKGFSPGNSTGMNMELFMEAAGRVMRDLKPDGLYYDGQYFTDPAALYALARRSRALVGEDGILEWHSTTALGYQHCYVPQADAYADFILRGEGRGTASDDYLRYFVSGYNINNAIGVLCNNVSLDVTPALIDRVLAVNARFHTLVRWLGEPEVMKHINERYEPRLTLALRAQVDANMDERQRELEPRIKERIKERAELSNPPEWGHPVFVESFDAMPEVEKMVSKENADPFSVDEGVLRVRGHGNTYAFLRIPVEGSVHGFVARLRHASGQGQSWGPAVALQWADGSLLRVGTRSDARYQSDLLGVQQLAEGLDPDAWTWYRVRWGNTTGVVEVSADGAAYRPLWWFDHGGAVTKPPKRILVGKVPYNGQPKDYRDPGAVGECEFDKVELYGE